MNPLYNPKPAALGGTPVRTKGWPDWPVWNPETDEERVIEVLRSGVWSRADVVAEFEETWAAKIGTKRALATTNGTHALIMALKTLGVDAGDEVLVTPYTFIATIDAIIRCNAMPIFVDIDLETLQMDPDKIEEKITPATKVILPVHIYGLPADMERIMGIAGKHNLYVVEDACQAWLAEINHKKVGSFGDLGCFSFQNSKHLPIGEGGALVGDDDEMMDRAFSLHNFGRPYGAMVTEVSGSYVLSGSKCRMTEYQAAIGLAQMKRLEEETTIRNRNADYLRSLLDDIPGILPHRLYPNVTRAAYHGFPLLYKKEYFQGLSRSRLISALRDEGIPCGDGYDPQNKNMDYLQETLNSKGFRRWYPEEQLDYDRYVTENQCSANDRLCAEVVRFGQNLLLTTEQDMDDIAEAIEKIRTNASQLVQS
ncbi:MAG TPA: DegT/DnrJ/EryC1/StrS family aminotransferase [bacterium]|nr:DegT/DnrJ/EryC1/StrS family aminotransferase [bacterium]